MPGLWQRERQGTEHEKRHFGKDRDGCDPGGGYHHCSVWEGHRSMGK